MYMCDRIWKKDLSHTYLRFVVKKRCLCTLLNGHKILVKFLEVQLGVLSQNCSR